MNSSSAALTRSKQLTVNSVRVLVPIGLLLAVSVASAFTARARTPSPPAAPTDLSASAVSSSEIDLSWTASAGNVAGYRIFRNEIQIATVTRLHTTYHDTHLAPSTTYVDTVRAFDFSLNISEPSTSASATTLDVPGRSPGTLFPPDGAVVLNPGDSIQNAVNANPSGTTFYLKAGTYRLTSAIVPKSEDVFDGAPGAILNGSKLLASFTRWGRYYGETGVPLQRRGNTAGHCDPNHSMCTYVQDLYLDNKPLTPVRSTGALEPSKWFFDRSRKIVYLYGNPSGHTVEIGLSYAAFDNQSATGVTIRGLTIEKFATPAPFGAIGFAGGGPGWTVEDNDVRLNHASGINATNDGAVHGNYVHDNGEEGITGGNVSNVVVTNNEMSFNNYAGYDCGWECGGMKFGATTNLRVVGNYAHDNLGIHGSGAPGLWCDVDCATVTFENNVVRNNGGGGISYEISHYGTFAYNIIQGNGSQNASWGWGSGLQINESDHVAVFGNLLTGNNNGIVGVQQMRGSGPRGTYELTDLYVHDNVTRVASSDPGTAAGIFQDDGDESVFTSINNNKYQHNTYVGLATDAKVFQWLDKSRTVAEWQFSGNDTNGTFNR
jgi:parallel beta-helix repeat protein